MRFYKDWDIKGYDSNSPYFRWKVSFTKDELENTIEKNLPLVYKDQKNYILTKTKDGFVSKDIPSNPIGNLLDIKVLKRGKGGNIMELLIVGDNGTYKIIKELNVRYVIRPRKSDTGSNKDVLINRIKGDDLKNASMLPSAFFTFDIEKDSDGKLKNVTLYGGGYGHGVGMSQYGAAYLSKEGYPFDKILKTYYKDINIEKIY
jgi:SpoIID/LytB domain protein